MAVENKSVAQEFSEPVNRRHSKVCVAIVSEETSETAVGDSMEDAAVDRYEIVAAVASEGHESSEVESPEVREEPEEAEEVPVRTHCLSNPIVLGSLHRPGLVGQL